MSNNEIALLPLAGEIAALRSMERDCLDGIDTFDERDGNRLVLRGQAGGLMAARSRLQSYLDEQPSGLALVDAIVRLTNGLDGNEFDTLRDRLSNIHDITSYTGWPEGLVIVREQSGQYTPIIDGERGDESFDEYHDALDRLRIAADDLMLAEGDASLVEYVNLQTGLQVTLLPVEQIVPDFERDTTQLFADYWQSSKGAVGREALCALCGETFNPADAADMTHQQRASDEQPCGGPGVPVGWWY
jgi:hypothetical protein